MSKAIIHAPKWNTEGVSLGRFLLVWVTSAVMNIVIIGGVATLFYFIDRATARPPEQTPEIAQNNQVEDTPKEADLSSTDIGADSTIPLNYNVERIEEVAVPGPVDATAAAGVVGAPESAPTNVPPPPGAGGGTGGATMDPNLSGAGAMSGTLGGLGGMYAAGGFGGRSGSTRKKMLAEGGGSTVSEAAVGKGLRFLALHQNAAGYWHLSKFNEDARTEPWPRGKVVKDNCVPMTTRGDQYNTAGAAFGLLPFLAAGITNKPSKDNVNQVDYSKTVGRAIEYLDNKQLKTGEQRGFYGGGAYAHGLATIAMCEAYGLTSDPKIKASAQMALNYIVTTQDPAGGGWRYTAREAGDTSVTGWMVMALKSGQMAGLTVPRPALKKVEVFLNACETKDKGGYKYVPNGDESIAMTAVGALCRQYLGVNPRNPSLLASIKKIKVPANGPANTNLYYTYYATQVMHHMGGEAWDYWNNGPEGKNGIRDVLVSRQDRGLGGRPGQEGSFAGDDHVGGRIGATSLSLLCLEVYYRHLPLYRRDAGAMKDKP